MPVQYMNKSLRHLVCDSSQMRGPKDVPATSTPILHSLFKEMSTIYSPYLGTPETGLWDTPGDILLIFVCFLLENKWQYISPCPLQYYRETGCLKSWLNQRSLETKMKDEDAKWKEEWSGFMAISWSSYSAFTMQCEGYCTVCSQVIFAQSFSSEVCQLLSKFLLWGSIFSQIEPTWHALTCSCMQLLGYEFLDGDSPHA